MIDTKIVGGAVAQSNQNLEDQLKASLIGADGQHIKDANGKDIELDPVQVAMLKLQHQQATENLIVQTLSNIIKSEDDTLSHISNKIG